MRNGVSSAVARPGADYTRDSVELRPKSTSENDRQPDATDEQISMADPDPAEIDSQAALDARLAALPKEVGVLLVTIGTMGVVLPGIVGTPALLAGGLMLWPRGFRVVNGWLQRKCPKIHGHGMAQLVRYLDDLERRYPTSNSKGSR